MVFSVVEYPMQLMLALFDVVHELSEPVLMKLIVRWNGFSILLTAFVCATPLCVAQSTSDNRTAEPSASASELQHLKRFLADHCLECHSNQTLTAGLSLEDFQQERLPDDVEKWEQVVRRLRVRQMPPPEQPRPNQQAHLATISTLERMLDAAAARNPRPGRTETFRRLTRTEYQNAIRDLLSLQVDVFSLLPPDESGHGFDNVTVSDLSPTLLSRSISAAQKISRLAVGSTRTSPDGDTIRIPADLTQEGHIDGLPLGTRGGALIPWTFPQDGEYEIQIRLARDRNEEVEGLKQPHELEVLLDNERLQLLTVSPPAGGKDFETVDAHLKFRFKGTAGIHQVGVTFLKNPSSLLEIKRQPLNARFNMHRHPRTSPAIYQISITGPYGDAGVGETASRRQIFVCYPEHPDDEHSCAEQILARLMRRAYRRPIDADDLQTPMSFYHEARDSADFDAGIEAALSAILVNPHFLFRIEQDPIHNSSGDHTSGAVYQISDLELASRLSFFLWSSIPDDELLDLAESEQLSHPDVLRQQTLRMLSDSRSSSLATNFGGQWLYLRNLESITPDLRLYPDFDENLRQSFRQETEHLFQSVQREDRSVLELLNTDETYLNERLAKHYGIPHIYGSRFRRVALPLDSHRGGLLRQGSILTVTSYANRTSPVIRGHWILKNLLGAAPPPPPADVPALKENTVAANLSVRERLAQHRANTACASCHDLMDPPGFALENYDAVGQWRNLDSDLPIDASATLADGTMISGVSELEQYLLQQPEVFVGTLVEKLLTFALGRGVDYSDAAAVRQIVRNSRERNFRFSSLVLGVVSSQPFQMRTFQ